MAETGPLHYLGQGRRFASSPRELCVVPALFEHCLGTQFDFIRQEVFLVRRDEPDMPERVFKRARPVTVKLILDRPDDLRACINCPRKQSIYVAHIHMKANWRAP